MSTVFVKFTNNINKNTNDRHHDLISVVFLHCQEPEAQMLLANTIKSMYTFILSKRKMPWHLRNRYKKYDSIIFSRRFSF